MSAIKIIRALLVADAALMAAVPAARIIAGVLPQNTVLPAIGITEISRVDHLTLNSQSVAHCTSRVQVTVIAQSYPQQKTVLSAVRHACRDKLGAGFAVLLDGTGPDFSDAETGFYCQSQDFKVDFNEPT